MELGFVTMILKVRSVSMVVLVVLYLSNLLHQGKSDKLEGKKGQEMSQLT
uniref:Uncharacterized protein n=1 Tax=Rhizophora mucronata TaxID=61149 RepID=A0A2P2PZX4_RHIMU